MSDDVLKVCKIRYESFNPLRISVEMPTDMKPGEKFEGEISIVIPDVHLNLFDLSMGGMIPDNPHIATTVDMQIYSMNTREPVELLEIFKMANGISEEMSKLAVIVRDEMKKRPLLG